MAEDASGDINYFLSVDKSDYANLALIRQWDNLKVGIDEDTIWVKDFDYVQINSTAVKSIPYKTIFYARQNRLYLLNSQLPDRLLPSLLWTPINRALPIKLPSFNHNYFGITEKVNISLVPTDREEEGVAMITSLTVLNRYIVTAPAIRIERIRWAVINSDQVLLLGKPLLPVTGNTYWQNKDALLPSGFNFELQLVSDIINKNINPARDSWVVWDGTGAYMLVPKESVQPLSLSSFRLTMAQLSIEN